MQTEYVHITPTLVHTIMGLPADILILLELCPTLCNVELQLNGAHQVVIVGGTSYYALCFDAEKSHVAILI